MNPTSATRSRLNPRFSTLAALGGLTLGVLAACSGGGGGGGVFTVTSTIFGFDPFTNQFDASGQQGEAPIIPVNMCVVFNFSDTVAPASVSTASVIVQELDTSVTPPAPGPLAAVEFEVSGARIVICPLLTFTDTNASFGFNPNKTYQILFQLPPSSPVVSSSSGRPIADKDRGPYLFKTSSTIFDQQPGPPVPSMRLLDSNGNVLNPAATPFKPPPLVEITFNEPVVPFTAVDPGGVGTSPSIRVELDQDGSAATTNDRFAIPGEYVLTQTNTSATVLFTSVLNEIPTDVAGVVYFVTVDGSVQDLSGHSKVQDTNDPGAKDEFTFVTIPGSPTTAADPVVEPFDVQDNSDASVTSARWGTIFPGFLSAGIGGGKGTDGVFDPNSLSFQQNPPADITVNVGALTVTMSTSHLGAHRVFEFTSFVIPVGWTVVAAATSTFPLVIQCSGNVQIDGLLDVSGANGQVYPAGQVGGGTGGLAAYGGAAGGRGGATTNTANTTTLFPSLGGGRPTYPQLACTAPVGGVLNQGLSGRNNDVWPALGIAAFQLKDIQYMQADLNGLAAALTDLWIQPNVGADDFRFERWHPQFKVTAIAAGIVTVESSAASANYRGEMTQETINPYIESDGNGGFRPPLLAGPFDSYVIGLLNGIAGGSLFDLDLDGTQDDASVYAGGAGSEAQTVMQTFLTLGRSGGAGGGGAIGAGSSGEDDPTVTTGAGAYGGTGTAGAAGGSAVPAGTVLAKIDSDTFAVQNSFFDDGTGVADQSYEGQLINPDTNQGHTFQIASVNTVSTVTITPIVTAGGQVIDLDDIIGLGNGRTFRISPVYEAGGTGGGGAGVHCAGSSKTPAGHSGHPDLTDARNQNGATNTTGFYDDDGGVAPPNQVQDGREDATEAIFTLPRWIPGGGGGAGGGAVRIVAAGNVAVGSTGSVLADGGEGGRSDAAGVSAASGGGGGAGGTIFCGAGGTLSVALGGVISAVGGAGGANGFGLLGGDGGDGRIRLENALGNLSAGDFAGVAAPVITAADVGTFPGGGESLAQSIFLSSGVLAPQYEQITILYDATVNGVDQTGLEYTVNADGSTDDGSGNPATSPFDLRLSFTIADAQTGLADLSQATPFADPTIDHLDQHDNQGYVRFQIVLADASQDVVIGLEAFRNIRIDSLSISLSGTKP